VVVMEKSPIRMQAASMKVRKNDVVMPSKLRMLADAGWSIRNTVKTRDGFELLLTRPLATEAEATWYEPSTPSVHLGGARCPYYCNCLNHVV
jgi:hypothetical protein